MKPLANSYLIRRSFEWRNMDLPGSRQVLKSLAQKGTILYLPVMGLRYNLSISCNLAQTEIVS
ncbi:MAG: hypothetical protein ABIQ56_00170 [Chitinophagaceae bacterium]